MRHRWENGFGNPEDGGYYETLNQLSMEATMDSSEGKQRFIAHPQDRMNIVSVVAAPVIFFYPFYHGIGAPLEFAIYAGFLLAWIVVLNYVLHLHVHRPLTTSAAFNRFADFALGSVTGMTSANWRIQHVLGHHGGKGENYTSHALEWTLQRYSLRGALGYSFGNVWPTFWRPLCESYHKGVRGNVREPINYRSAFIEQVCFILFVLALGICEPALTIGFLLPRYVMIFAMTRYVDYLNHYGCTDEGMNFANNCLSPSFNWRINNFGYHTAHHLDPRAHWTTLPQLHDRIADRIPPPRIKTFDWSFALLPYHAWRERRTNP